MQEKRILEKCDTRHKNRRMEWLVVEKKNGKEIYQWTSQEPDLTNKANIVATQAPATIMNVSVGTKMYANTFKTNIPPPNINHTASHEQAADKSSDTLCLVSYIQDTSHISRPPIPKTSLILLHRREISAQLHLSL